jgi:hypothetical protein
MLPPSGNKVEGDFKAIAADNYLAAFNVDAKPMAYFTHG